MSKNLIIGIVVAILALAGIVLLLTRSTTQGNNQGDNAQESTQNITSSIAGLIALGKNIRCTYDYMDDSGNRNQGTVYAAGENVRGDFMLSGPSGDSTSHMIRMNNTQYVWQDGNDEGYKVDLSSQQQTSDDGSSDGAAVNPNEELNLNCQDTTVDSSMFNIPDQVNFVDQTKQLESLQQQQSEAGTACNQITDAAAKAACLQAAGAN